MPATAGRVRMPANNRVHSSAALQTHGIWQSAIGYDPYAPDQKQPPPSGAAGDRDAAAAHGPSSDQQNAYDSFQGLLALARLTGSNADEARGSCRKCGRVGHLPFQCRNFLVLKDEASLAAAAAASFSGFTDRDGGGAAHRKDKGHKKRRQEGGTGRGNDNGNTGSDLSCEDQSSDDEESGLSDSSEDSEMERAIAAKFGRNILKFSSHKSKLGHKKERSDATRHKKSHSKRIKSRKDASEDDDGSSEEEKKKSKHHLKSKRSLKNASESDEESRGSDSDSEVERKRKNRRHSHKRSTSKRKHSEKLSEGSSEGEDAERKKRRRRGWHKNRKHG